LDQAVGVNEMGKLDARLQEVADKYTQSRSYAGIVWQVQKSGETIAQGTSGTADEAGNAQLKQDAIFRIYSMTKPIVSVMALILIQRGQLRLSDFVMQFIPAFASTEVLCPGGTEPQMRPITIEDLLTHRSGISYDFVPDCPIGKRYLEADLLNSVEYSLAEFADVVAGFPLAFQPGTEWRYSYSTDVLARVLEVVSGQPLDELLEQNIMAPLGMGDTSFYVPDDRQHRLLPLFGFETIDLSFEVPPPHDLVLLDGEAIYPSRPGHNALRGGLGLYSTCADYLKFAAMLLSGKLSDGTALISPAMHELMLANRIPQTQMPLEIGPMTFPGYGFNLIGRVMGDLGQAMSLTAVGEFGWEGAAGTYFWVDPKNALVGVVMTQFLGTYLPMREEMRAAVYGVLGE